MNRRGTTLLETMIALVILSTVVVGFLELFGGTARTSRDVVAWATAVEHAEAGMERVKLAPDPMTMAGVEDLGDGFRRETRVRPWRSGLRVVTVVVRFPDGGAFTLERVVPAP